MSSLHGIFALAFAGTLLVASLAAENTPAPPNWQDGQGASVYLQPNASAPSNVASLNDEHYVAERPFAETTQAAPSEIVAVPRIDPAVVPAVHEQTIQDSSIGNAQQPDRRLAPQTHRAEAGTTASQRTSSALRSAAIGIPTESIYTVITGLAIVVGAFLVFTWALRRGSKGRHGRGVLPSEVVSVLGRVPIAARQFAELLRVGNKLVLVALTPTGPATLTEVTDPVEVDRLVGMCQQVDPHSTTKVFEQVFQQFSSEPTSGGYLENDPLPASLSSAASAYRSHRGSSRA
jgi:flagellar biogenesis protein FliO